MSAEHIIFAALRSLVADRVYPDVAPAGAALPRIVYQQVGGRSMQYSEGNLATSENARMQLVCWATTREAATTLAKQAEDALLAAAGCTVEPLGQRIARFEEDTGLRGAQQDFSITSPR
ncbi:MAG: DUF3168 domain-containing protein [Acidovorax sp.]|uniref:DUF3168 domain-containing protein n=1 Tax=Acidovorax sp. TaxID=1872122 RepID=UPI002621584B|nr:DUF3168 domain-containing protein [Acidovorax sp.]MDH4425069.1 DUF3168 domain-containing protein [Acidovorax sp.]